MNTYKEKLVSEGSVRGELLVYQTEDRTMRFEVKLENEIILPTQQMMAELFQPTKQNIGMHLKKFFEEGELESDSVVKKFFTTAVDGKRYNTLFLTLIPKLQ
jgi:hypothetical protein